MRRDSQVPFVPFATLLRQRLRRGALLPRLVALLLAATPLASPASPALAKKHGCLACHAAKMQLVGPSYQAVAEKYTGQADAVAALAKKIRAGGAGVWGEVPMPPQAGVSEADARRLATWVMQGGK